MRHTCACLQEVTEAELALDLAAEMTLTKGRVSTIGYVLGIVVFMVASTHCLFASALRPNM